MMISIILKLVHPLTKRLGSRWAWNRGRRYHVMAKLDPVKISWIINQKEKGTRNQEISHSMNISVRWIQKLYSGYRSTGIIPALKQPGRPKRQVTEHETSIVSAAFTSVTTQDEVAVQTNQQILKSWEAYAKFV